MARLAPEPARNVRDTVATATQVLAALERSLEAAGFRDAAESYPRMADVLVGQRFWAGERADPAMRAGFVELAGVARRVHALLAPVGLAVQALAVLDAGDLIVGADPAAGPDERVLAHVRGVARPVSATRIAADLGLERPTARAALTALVARGALREVRSGGSIRYAATAPAPGEGPAA